MIVGKKLFILSLCLAAAFIAHCYAEEGKPKYPDLHEFIKTTQFIDVHSHPSTAHVSSERQFKYPTLEPPIFRPFWITDHDKIAVWESMQVEALQKIYGYSGTSVTADDIAGLEELSRKLWSAGKKDGLNKILDLCGIQATFYNSGYPKKDLDPGRTFWVPFVDFLLYPANASQIESINMDLRRTLKHHNESVEKEAARLKISLQGIGQYKKFIRALLTEFKSDGAVAVKVASAYYRTLWFDYVDGKEADLIYMKMLKEPLNDWKEYKRLQDYIARLVFSICGELDLPVHIHTGFGASATLKNLDSNPLNLESIFSDRAFQNTRLVMLHAGYPFSDKLKPLLEKKNVFVEFSAVNWMVFRHELADILFDWLSYPGASEKIMFGADAGAPVFFQIAAENSRAALYDALSRLIEKQIIDESKAKVIAEKIMRGNALRIHKLNLQ